MCSDLKKKTNFDAAGPYIDCLTLKLVKHFQAHKEVFLC